MQHLHSLLEDAVDTVNVAPSESSVETMRFRAPTVDEALADATSEIGREVEILEANRIRRGGVGGFFATDLGVEIVVTPVQEQRRDHERLGIPDRQMPETYVAPTARRRHPSDVEEPMRRNAPSSDDRRPQFYDRVIEESGEPEVPEVPRRRPRAEAPPATRPSVPPRPPVAVAPSEPEPAAGAEPVDDSITAQINSESFATHFARQMAIDPTADPDPAPMSAADVTKRLRFGDLDEATTRSESPIDSAPIDLALIDSATPASPAVARARRVRTTVARRERSSTPSDATTAAPDPQSAAPACPPALAVIEAQPEKASEPGPEATDAPDTTTVGRDDTPESAADEIVVSATAPAPATAPPTKAKGASKPGRSSRRDPLRRPTEVVAAAVTGLVDQLSTTAPVDGSRVQDLRSLRVKLTTSDGDVIEMTAKLGDE